MILYDAAFSPPAPILSVIFQHPQDAARVAPAQMQIDTGADLTCIPESVVSALDLVKEHDTLITGYDGVAKYRAIYHVTIRIENYVIKRVRVIAISEKIGLLGRDVLRGFTVTLRGKEQTFDITDP